MAKTLKRLSKTCRKILLTYKVNICCYFSYRRLLENFFDKTLSDNNMAHQMKKVLKMFVMGDDNSFKSFTFFIYVIPVFFYIKIFRCGFVNFEIFKSFSKFLSNSNSLSIEYSENSTLRVLLPTIRQVNSPFKFDICSKGHNLVKKISKILFLKQFPML